MKLIRKALNWPLAAPTSDPFTRLLFSWRLWILGALTGVLLAAGVYAVAPPPYRAQATVVVDHNLEAWQYFPDRRLFHFLERETRKLEEVAWSDETLEQVAEEVGGISVSALRSDVLLLSQPAEGGWHFLAEDPDPQRAERLASTWAQTFVKEAREGVEVSLELEAARARLNQALLEDLAEDGEPDPGKVEELMDEIELLAEQTEGISPYIELSLSQGENLPVERRVPRGSYMLVGSGVGAATLAALALFLLKEGFEESVGG